MLQLIFAIHDGKAEAYLPPFYMHHEGQATRVFQDCINSKKHQFSHHPADYTIFQIGTYNDANAEINSHAPKSLGNGVEFIKIPPAQEYLDEKRHDPLVQPSPPSGNSAKQL